MTPISKFCELWSDGKERQLWQKAKESALHCSKAHKPSRIISTQDAELLRINGAISCAEQGLFHKACTMLTSTGLAPDSEATWEKLKAKHPFAPPPIAPPTVDQQESSLDKDFDILNCLQSFPKATACGPSMLRVQHLIDVTRNAFLNRETQLPSLLHQLVILLASGEAPTSLAPYLAGGNLVALMKIKEGGEWDVRPIPVGEVLRRLTGKCLCSVTKIKASQFFHPHQYGVACPGGSEKIVHRLRSCIEKYWGNGDFVILKIDMHNAFNSVSRQWVLDECKEHFPELLPWVSWCYSQHPLLWYTSGVLHSADGVQQGDPLGPLLFALVLHKLVMKLDAELGADLLLNVWFLDDGALCGPREVIIRALQIFMEDGPSLGLHLNLAKCELFSPQSFNVLTPDGVLISEQSFPPQITKRSHIPNLVMLGAPIGDTKFCSAFVEEKRLEAQELLQLIPKLHEPQVAVTLLRKCGPPSP